MLGKLFGSLAISLAALAPSASPAPPPTCSQIVLTGQATTGNEWRQPIGQGWVFRLAPVAPGPSAYTGWDLVIDRDPPLGYPDALLLATPPYNSINEREIATTFGLRAQDALGWNPRTFRFLTDPAAYDQARRLFLSLGPTAQPAPTGPQASSLQKLAALYQHSSQGQFRILDARIVPGTSDPAPFAQKWALQASRTPHSNDASSAPTPRGALQSITFSITLWLPANWRTPQDLHPTHVPCPQ